MTNVDLLNQQVQKFACICLRENNTFKLDALVENQSRAECQVRHQKKYILKCFMNSNVAFWRFLFACRELLGLTWEPLHPVVEAATDL